MSKSCNPKNPKAKDPTYECNSSTGRWVKKKLSKKKSSPPRGSKPCNPNSPNAKNPNYECNPATGRWRKKMISKKKSHSPRGSKPCNPKNPNAKNPNYECNPATGRWRKKRVSRKKSPSPKRKSPSPKRKSPSPKRKSPPKGKKCDPNDDRAYSDYYECNPKTGKWVRRKDYKECNPGNSHARDPNWECDHTTGRWRKKIKRSKSPKRSRSVGNVTRLIKKYDYNPTKIVKYIDKSGNYTREMVSAEDLISFLFHHSDNFPKSPIMKSERLPIQKEIVTALAIFHPRNFKDPLDIKSAKVISEIISTGNRNANLWR